jgi:5'-phosphate synthase pdxT subunit
VDRVTTITSIASGDPAGLVDNGTVNRPLIGVLALQGDVREHRAAFERCGCPTISVRLPEELDRIDALALPGGESTTISRLLRVFAMEEPLRRRLERGLPTFSTCAGMIVLGKEILDGRPDQLALGALDVSLRRNGYGRQVESFEADIDIPDVGPPHFRGVFIRAPRVLSVGDGARVIARLGDDPVALVQGPHLALAFHPELSGDDRLHHLYVERVLSGSLAA